MRSLALHYAVFDCTKAEGVTVYMRTAKGAHLAAVILSKLTGRFHDYAGDLVGAEDTLGRIGAEAGRLAICIVSMTPVIAFAVVAAAAVQH